MNNDNYAVINLETFLQTYIKYEVQARAPRGDPPRKQDFLRIFLIEKNLLAVSTGKL